MIKVDRRIDQRLHVNDNFWVGGSKNWKALNFVRLFFYLVAYDDYAFIIEEEYLPKKLAELWEDKYEQKSNSWW